jgi:cyclohexanecarboxylate-CoA ligase
VSLDELLAAAPARTDLVVHDDARLSTAELEERVGGVAGGMVAAGVGPGDRVAFQLPVGIDAIVLYRACWRIGAVAVALHPAAGPHQLDASIAQSAPALLVGVPGVPLADRIGVVDIADLDGPTPPAAVPGPHDDALIMFTSGSTGAPKGVVHTHGGLRYKVEQSIDVHRFTLDDTVLMPAPLAHVSGLLHGVLVCGTVGMKAVLMSKWDPGTALDLIEAEQVTYMVGPPTFFIGLMDHPDFRSDRTASLRLLSCGGAGVTPAFAERARSELGAVVKRAYGSTEAPTVATSRFDDPPERMTTTDGRAFGETRLRVDDDGELWVTGPELARGYLDVDETAVSFVDGWFRTGDLATLDDGWLTITGRLGDRIIRGGENISATEVEQHLEAHPAVRAAVAVAEPDDRLGERVAAFVVAPDGFDLETCRSWFTERGATRFITPERVVVVDELPVLASGKPDRAMLRSRLTGGNP